MTEIPIVLIGHKDHGKSTLIGRLLLDTKSIQESRLKEIQEVDKAAGQKFELAHLVDSFREEREREMTMDTTRALLKGKRRNYQLIDVPGHAELISHMLTGASAAQGALLLVSVAEGIEEQTRQHLEIAKLLGIEQLGVAVNKLDKVNWQEDSFNEIVVKLKEILSQIGYSSQNIHFFPISAWEGDNVVKKSENVSWYQGPTLMEFLEKGIKEPASFDNLPFAFLVQDKYQGEKEILMGPVESGKVKAGEEILFLPSQKKTKIQKIQDSEGEVTEAVYGKNIGMELEEDLNIKRGSVGVLAGSDFVQVSDDLSGEIFWIARPSDKELIIECGTARVEGVLQEPEEITAGRKTSYSFLAKESIVFVPQGKIILGKIVLKDKGKIIGVGNIK